MGQKVNPYGARVGVIREYDTCWYSSLTVNEFQTEASLRYWLMLNYLRFLQLKNTLTTFMKRVMEKPYMKALVKLLI